MLMSTGMASEIEISEALETARSNGCNSLLLFHCISSYPAPAEQANLKQILNLKNTFGVSIGLSDHTLGNSTAIAAVALGACVIEKHFTINRNDKGPDSEFSVEPDELKALVRDTKSAWKALGSYGFGRPDAELNSTIFRRSIYFVSDVKAGEKITSADIRRIRPGFGLPPKYFNELVGKTVIRDVKRGDAARWDMIFDNA
jgi:N-acetylneuraminate synthase